MDSPYDNRTSKWVSRVIDPYHPSRVGDVDESYGGQGPFATSRTRPTPTTIFKKCDAGHAECDAARGSSQGAFMGLVVPHECARGATPAPRAS